MRPRQSFWVRIRHVFELIAVMAFVMPMRFLPIDWASGFGGALGRCLGPRLPVSRVARANLRHAYPEKSDAEIETILRGVWDNLGRCLCEYPHLPHIWDVAEDGRGGGGRIDPAGASEFAALRESGKPAIIFGAHIANWELLPIAPARHGMPVTVLFRPPNNPMVAALLQRIREAAMGDLISTGVHTAIAAVEVLDRGGRLGLLVDQHALLGVPVPFFGRPAKVSALLGKLARRYGCEVRGSWIERLDGARFRINLTPPIALPPFTDDAAADATAIMAKVTSVGEEWVRARPEQWLWIHRRWRQ